MERKWELMNCTCFFFFSFFFKYLIYFNRNPVFNVPSSLPVGIYFFRIWGWPTGSSTSPIDFPCSAVSPLMYIKNGGDPTPVPNIEFILPIGSTIWTKGTNVRISWQAKNCIVEGFNISLIDSKNPSFAPYTIATLLPMEQTYYDFDVPTTFPTDIYYQLKISASWAITFNSSSGITSSGSGINTVDGQSAYYTIRAEGGNKKVFSFL